MKNENPVAENKKAILDSPGILGDAQLLQRLKELKHALITVSQAVIEDLEAGKDTRDIDHILHLQKLVIEELQLLHHLQTLPQPNPSS